ncbi:MAG TPA: hypothetical protein VG013_05710 [Gemmataceae bacterium]|nr:hypothetical protein [Gemmataceae bacterium]
MNEPRFIIEEVTDPVEIARSRAQHEQFQRNIDWVQAHWADLLPQALGKFLAVAGQEAFLADTPEEVIAWAKSVHPEDEAPFFQYVRPERGPRFYGNRWPMGLLS